MSKKRGYQSHATIAEGAPRDIIPVVATLLSNEVIKKLADEIEVWKPYIVKKYTETFLDHKSMNIICKVGFDSEELVCCKDCKYYVPFYLGEYNEHVCRHPNLEFDIECSDLWIDVKEDDYCSYGERRTDED